MGGPEFRYRLETHADGDSSAIHSIRRGNTTVLEFVYNEDQAVILQRVLDHMNRDCREIILAEDKIFRQDRVIEDWKALVGILLNRLHWCSEKLPRGENKQEVTEWIQVARRKRRELSLIG